MEHFVPRIQHTNKPTKDFTMDIIVMYTVCAIAVIFYAAFSY